jgi:hypothetical protein
MVKLIIIPDYASVLYGKFYQTAKGIDLVRPLAEGAIIFPSLRKGYNPGKMVFREAECLWKKNIGR